MMKNRDWGTVEKGVAKMQALSNRRNMCSIMLKTEEISGTVSISQVTVPANFRLGALFQQSHWHKDFSEIPGPQKAGTDTATAALPVPFFAHQH